MATSASRDRLAIGFFPDVTANLGARVEWRGALLGAAARHVGRIFLDDSEDPAGRLAPRTVLDLDAGYRRPLGDGREAMLMVRVFNALDKRYETGGYFDYDDNGNYGPLIIPAATRNALAELRVEF